MYTFNGVRVIVNDTITVTFKSKQWFFPVSKSKRAQKKARKNDYSYYKIREDHAFNVNSPYRCIIVSEKVFEKMKEHLVCDNRL